MNPIFQIYNLLFYQPIFQILLFFTHFFSDFGIAIILLTVLIRIILFPFAVQASQMKEKIDNVQKELKEIEKKYNGEEKTKKIAEIYKKEKINPFFGLFSLFFQIPILLALYQVLLKGVKETSINSRFLGFFDLSKTSLFLAVLAVLLQFFYSETQNIKQEDQKFSFFPLGQFNFLLSFFTFLILIKLPSAISLYLAVNFLLLIFQKRIFHA